MAVGKSSKMPDPGPRNLEKLANAAKKHSSDVGVRPDQVDERGFLFGRVIIIKLVLKETSQVIMGANGKQAAKMPAKQWRPKCVNRAELIAEVRQAKKMISALSESRANKTLREKSRGVLEYIGLGPDFPVFFAEDMVLLEGYADHHLDGSCPGLPPDFRAFLARFRRHLIPIEQFGPLFETLSSDGERDNYRGGGSGSGSPVGKIKNKPVSNVAVDYTELLFPPPEFATGRELGREVIVCLNTAEWDTDLGRDALLPCWNAPDKYRATTGRCGYGEEIARVMRGYHECLQKSVSHDRISRAAEYHRVICVFRKAR